jgi:hypothetical protein
MVVPGAGGTMANADLLQLSRRLDWRFLLREPGLGRVAYVGAAPSGLLDALRRFAAAVTVLPGANLPAGTAPGAEFDLVVLRDPPVPVLRRAATLAGTHGAVDAEIRRLVAGGRPAVLRHPASYADVVRRAGFEDVRLHWHWPGFDACRAIVPLDEPAALSYFLAAGAARPLRRLAARSAGAILRGAAGWAVPRVSVLGQRA